MAKKDIKNAHCNKLAGKQFYPKRDSTQLAGKKAGVPVLVSLQVLLLWGGVRLWGASRKTSAPRVGLSPPAVTPLLTPRLQGSKRRVMSKYCPNTVTRGSPSPPLQQSLERTQSPGQGKAMT